MCVCVLMCALVYAGVSKECASPNIGVGVLVKVFVLVSW